MKNIHYYNRVNIDQVILLGKVFHEIYLVIVYFGQPLLELKLNLGLRGSVNTSRLILKKVSAFIRRNLAYCAISIILNACNKRLFLVVYYHSGDNRIILPYMPIGTPKSDFLPSVSFKGLQKY